MTLQALLSLAAILFCAGLFCVLTRRNAVSILMGVELMLNAANINFVAFSNWRSVAGSPPEVTGHLFALFTIVVAAAEAVVVLAIILAIFRRAGTIEADSINQLKE